MKIFIFWSDPLTCPIKVPNHQEVPVFSLALIGILSATLGIRETFFLAGGLMTLSGVYAWYALRKVKE
jgi:hypothetical protein